MVLTLTLPEPGEKKRIKDVILDLLSFEWPLSLSQIHNRLSKNYNCTTTCQATYKAICELLREGVLCKQDRLYSLNMEWISKLKEFSSHIENNYTNENKLPLIEGVLKTKTENNVTILTFDSLVEMDKTWINIKKEYYKHLDKKDDVSFWEGEHCWWLLVYPELEYSEMEIIKEKRVKHFFINHGNTTLDKWAQKFYQGAGVKFKVSKDKVESDMAVFGDTIMQTTLPKDVREKIEEIYQKCKDPSCVILPDFIEGVLNKKRQINLILTKNKEIAEQLKKKVVNEFNGKV